MLESQGSDETQGRIESEEGLGPSQAGSHSLCEQECTHWDPKDGELWCSRTKSEETQMEVGSDSNVQTDRQTWV